MELSAFVSTLERFCPPALGEKWDNVGLLVEPSAPATVKRVLLTNDLTEDVMDEVLDRSSCNSWVFYFNLTKYMTHKNQVYFRTLQIRSINF